MTTSGRYLRLHVCIDNRRALAQRLFHGAAREFPMTVPAVCIGLKKESAFLTRQELRLFRIRFDRRLYRKIRRQSFLICRRLG